MTITNSTSLPRAIELLAPARNADIAIEAIRHGADAVYIGAEFFGARSEASNTLAEIARAVEFAHSYQARIFVTLNTILYDDELSKARALIESLYTIGVDALIIQDLGLLDLDLPPVELHASTQCNIRTSEEADFLRRLGISRLILPRELTLEETSAIAQNVGDTELEAFVHGALCVSYSGDCQAGQVLANRSANRGRCPQICRHLYTLEDDKGNRLLPPRHLLSLRDLNRSDYLEQMMAAGITSFKIEGRLKDAGYVKNIVAHYRTLIDSIIMRHPDKYRRASLGNVHLNFTPDPAKSFNRGFTSYFTTERKPTCQMASMLTPKWAGEEVGSVLSAKGSRLICRLLQLLNNGDGLTYFTPAGTLEGFNVNIGAQPPTGTVIANRKVDIAKGTPLYRNIDKQSIDMLSRRDTATRQIPLDLTLRHTQRGIALDAIVSGTDIHASVSIDTELNAAQTPQLQVRKTQLSRTGGTQYSVASIVDNVSADTFVPNSILSELRRNLINTLTHTIASRHHYSYRKSESNEAVAPTTLTYHNNVANRRAREVYTRHGAQQIQPAIELQTTPQPGTRIMTTRYCLRRELGACLRTPQGRRLPSQLYIHDGKTRLALKFDCNNCEMHVIK